MNPVQSEAPSGRRTLLVLISGVLLLAFGWMLAAGDTLEAQPPAQGGDRAAVIDGKVITLQDVQTKAKAQLDQLDVQRQQMEQRLAQERQNRLLATLNEMVEERLLQLEGAATGKTADELIAAEVTGKITAVTDAEVDTFYTELQQQGRPGLPPKENIVPQIKAHLTQEREQGARASYLESLRAKFGVEQFLSEPRTEVAAVGPAKGPENAPVTLVEFSDFQCPFCARVIPALDQVTAKYGDKVRLVFRQFPLDIHPQAPKAAEAALCANEQGKFWQMHDAMFQDQQKLQVADLKATAGKLGVDQASFDSCLDGGKYAAQVQEDLRAGMVAGVSGTPAVFVNGKMLSGAQPFEAFAAAIDAELARIAKRSGQS
jgi:predicted DsbA family dithiol-disulfide isomerase